MSEGKFYCGEAVPPEMHNVRIVPTNDRVTTTKTHITLNGGTVEDIFKSDALEVTGEKLFKGDSDLDKPGVLIAEQGAERIAFVRGEAGTDPIDSDSRGRWPQAGCRRLCTT